MRRSGNLSLVWLFSLGACLAALACKDRAVPVAEDYILKSGTVVISSAEFSDELELKKVAYPFDLKTDPDAYNIMVMDLVSTLSDEVLLLAAAREKGIQVEEEELEAEETRFRSDYPEDSFDQMLMENAITYTAWRARFKKDLIMGKLLRKELIEVQEITPEDVVAFYKRHGGGQEAGPDPAFPMDEASLVEQLRLEKSQSSYEAWVAAIKERHPVQINKKALSAFLVGTE